MYSFESDYTEGAHPKILRLLAETNLEQTKTYGEDPYSRKAALLIKEQIDRENAEVFFISGGTQTNLIAISAFLRPHEAVISADTGHIEVHETGAIEATGHKVIPVPSCDGKLYPETILPVFRFHVEEHMVKPRMVYISNATELGTVYSVDEITALHSFCRENDMLLYLDGARIGAALTADGADLTFEHLGRFTDAFYIGGTKNGALLGEALVVQNPALARDMRYIIKQRGGLLAKGRLLGLQFLALFEDGLFWELARHANTMATILRNAIREIGYPEMAESPTNQLFPILPNDMIAALRKDYIFRIIEATDDVNSCIRLVTSWATQEADVRAFANALSRLSV